MKSESTAKQFQTAMHSYFQIVYYTIKRRKSQYQESSFLPKVKRLDLWSIHTRMYLQWFVCVCLIENKWKFKYERKYMCCH